MHRKKHLSHPALIPLWKSLEKDWLLQLIAKMSIFAVALVVLAIGLRTFSVVLAIGIALTGFSIWLVLQHFRRKGNLEKLQDRLYDNPRSIVWVYTVILEHHPFGLQFSERGLIYFKFDNGDEISAYLPPQKLKFVSKVLERSLPYTTFGYTKERAEQYKKDPHLVSKWQG